jgi:hypothetical protein
MMSWQVAELVDWSRPIQTLATGSYGAPPSAVIGKRLSAAFVVTGIRCRCDHRGGKVPKARAVSINICASCCRPPSSVQRLVGSEMLIAPRTSP